MSILITGGASYIGSHIAESLINKKYNVIILDNLKNRSQKIN
jgi:UDP-glucose 4-epimerase